MIELEIFETEGYILPYLMKLIVTVDDSMKSVEPKRQNCL
jgi:hypothetical protein